MARPDIVLMAVGGNGHGSAHRQANAAIAAALAGTSVHLIDGAEGDAGKAEEAPAEL